MAPGQAAQQKSPHTLRTQNTTQGVEGGRACCRVRQCRSATTPVVSALARHLAMPGLRPIRHAKVRRAELRRLATAVRPRVRADPHRSWRRWSRHARSYVRGMPRYAAVCAAAASATVRRTERRDHPGPAERASSWRMASQPPLEPASAPPPSSLASFLESRDTRLTGGGTAFAADCPGKIRIKICVHG